MVDITNFTRFKIDRKLLRRVFEKALKMAHIGKEPDISLVFVNEAKIREINKKYRNKNAVTDILSFEGLDEIFICPPAVKKQARELKTPFARELMRVLIHGILHLNGYRHERSKKAAEKMRKKEEEILRKINGRAKK